MGRRQFPWLPCSAGSSTPKGLQECQLWAWWGQRAFAAHCCNTVPNLDFCYPLIQLIAKNSCNLTLQSPPDSSLHRSIQQWVNQLRANCWLLDPSHSSKWDFLVANIAIVSTSENNFGLELCAFKPCFISSLLTPLILENNVSCCCVDFSFNLLSQPINLRHLSKKNHLQSLVDVISSIRYHVISHLYDYKPQMFISSIW